MKRFSIYLLLITCTTWLFFSLRTPAALNTLSTNDLNLHQKIVDNLKRQIGSGHLNLDTWFDNVGLGAAVMRTYQHIPHLIVATLAVWFPDVDSQVVLRNVLFLCIALQIPAAYFAASSLGLNSAGSLAASWAMVLFSHRLGLLGHSLQMYSVTGVGLFTQAVALPFFLTGIGLVARRTDAWMLGIYLGWMFLVHHFFGAMLILLFLVLQWNQHRIRRLTTIITGFLLVTAYQWLSIIQDRALIPRTSLESSEHWDGYRMVDFLYRFLGGDLLDSDRAPWLTGLAVLGMIYSAIASRQVKTRLYLIVGLAVLGLVGRQELSFFWNAFPMSQFFHFERFLVLFQISAALLIGMLFTANAYVAYGSPASLTLMIIGLVSLGFATQDFLGRLMKSEKATQQQWLVTRAFDGYRLGLSSGVEAGDRVWFGTAAALDTAVIPERRDHLKLGFVPFFFLSESVGLQQLSFLPQHMTYASEAVVGFSPANLDLARLFDISAIYLRRSETPPPGSLQFLNAPSLSGYRVPRVGPLEPVDICSLEILPDEKFLEEQKRWVRDYPSGACHVLIPQSVAAAEKRNLPVPSRRHATLITALRKKDSGFDAEVWSSAPGYLMLKRPFHWRWRIEVNGTTAKPIWLMPGFVGFAVQPGSQHVNIRFAEDPLRKWLAWISLVTFFTSVCASFLEKLPRFARGRSGSLNHSLETI